MFIVKQLLKRYKLSFHQIIPNDPYIKANGIDYYVNTSYYTYPLIILGMYNNNRKQLVSFFHELGHHLAPYPKSKYQNEYYAWIIGLSIAQNYKIKFDKNILKFATKQLNTYQHTKSLSLSNFYLNQYKIIPLKFTHNKSHKIKLINKPDL